MEDIRSLEPKSLWGHFYSLTQIPRPSGHLEKIQQYLLDFSKENGIEAFLDPAGNIVMRVPATPGMENRKGVILQGHMDMVPQKSPDSKHNFETDPIETYVEDDWVKAKGTTLGSDDGIGVATVMAVMTDKNLKHGPIEGLITRDEETGMYGANDLPEGELNGDILLNLDSETWGKFVVGSAGGIDVNAELEYKEEPVAAGMKAVKVTLKGLRGGHSGLEINEGRGNANKLMVRFVREAIATCEARLATWDGGNMRNAIPFKATVELVVPAGGVDKLKALVEKWKEEFVNEYAGIESGIEMFAEDTDVPKTIAPQEIQDNLVDAIYACHDGVVRMIPHFPEVVETSSNLAIIKIADGRAEFNILARSSKESMKEYIALSLESCFCMAGMKVTFSGSYGGWDPNNDSEILALLKEKYKEMFGKDALVQVDHAGLECSVILGKYPGLDVVSLGPTLRSPHTTSERCYVPSVAEFYQFITKVLENIPEK